MPVKVADAIRKIEDAGWYFVAQRGSHRQYKHRARPGRVTIPGKPGDDLHPRNWRGRVRQAGLTDE